MKPPEYWGSPRATRASSASDTPTKPISCHPNFTKGGLETMEGVGGVGEPAVGPPSAHPGLYPGGSSRGPLQDPRRASATRRGTVVGGLSSGLCLPQVSTFTEHSSWALLGRYFLQECKHSRLGRLLPGMALVGLLGSRSSSRGGGWFWESVPGLPSGWELRVTPPWEPGLLWSLCSIQGLLCDLRSEARPLWARRANGTDSVFSPHHWP